MSASHRIHPETPTIADVPQDCGSANNQENDEENPSITVAPGSSVTKSTVTSPTVAVIDGLAENDKPGKDASPSGVRSTGMNLPSAGRQKSIVVQVRIDMSLYRLFASLRLKVSARSNYTLAINRKLK